jgi:DMSO/TMAO reductase YedYZ molybdopterin-dependent catalytic subunit
MRALLSLVRAFVNALGKSGLGPGAAAAVLLTPPLLGLMYLLDQLLGVPFVPFALFDWISRVLPGPVVTFGLDLMIDGIGLVGLDVADVAKTAEQAMAILLVFFTCVVAGAAFFAVLKGRATDPQLLTGLVLGTVIGVPMAVVSIPMGQSDVSPVFILLGVMALFLAWGISFIPAYRRLVPTRAETPVAEAEVRSVQVLSRRSFLIRLGATTATITVLSGGLGSLLAQAEQRRLDEIVGRSMDTPETISRVTLPNANDPVAPAPGTRPEYTPVADHYKVFIRTEPSVIDIATWTLPILGLVDNPLNLTLEDLQNNYEPRDQFVTLSCISGRIGTSLISTTQWNGASLQEILADAQLQSEARYLVITSADGFYETVDLDLIASDQRIMLAYAWDGQPIPVDHGFPLRVWIPDRYGMKQPKWITGIEVTSDYREGYWVERGWDEVAQMKATSVIDTVAVDNIIENGDQRLVPVGGIAFAGARGISRVQLRDNGGPWQDAQLRAPLSETTWVIWRFDWPFQPGNHNFEVRCVDGDGNPQIEEESDSHPSGATGIHSKKARI